MEAVSRTRTITDRSFNDKINGRSDLDDEGDEEEECCNVEAWQTLSKSFKEVQSVLDHNRRLIQQVNDNHQSLAPRDLAKNVELIGEINANISKVVGLYSTLSANFTSIVQQRRGDQSRIHELIDR